MAGLWRLRGSRLLASRATVTWRAERDGTAVVVKHFGPDSPPDRDYPLRVMAALRRAGWPVPEVAEEPLIRPDGVWVVFHWLPGRSVPTSRDEAPEARLARGRLLAELHADLAATGPTGRRAGFPDPEDVVADPDLDRWLRVHEAVHPDEGRLLRTYRDAAASWFADRPASDAPRGALHGDFTPWNLLHENGRLTGVLDFELSHRAYLVTDFVLSWRGCYDEVLRGYDEVRPLSGAEWELLRPVFWSWMFLGVKDSLAGHYGVSEPERGPGVGQLGLEWQVQQLRRESRLLSDRLGLRAPALPGVD